MPTLPDDTSLGQRPVPVSSRGAPGYTGGIAEGAAIDANLATAKLGQTIGAVGDKIAETQDRLNYAGGLTDFLNAKLAADQAAKDDPDYATLPERYQQTVTKARDAAAAKIMSPTLRSDFLANVNFQVGRGADSVQTLAHSKRNDADRGWLANYVQGAADGFVNAPDEETRAQYIKSADSVIGTMQARGSITAEQGVKLGREIAVSAVKRYVTKQIDVDPVGWAQKLAPSSKQPASAGGQAALSAAMPADLTSAIGAAADAHGQDADTLTRIANLESGGNAGAANASGAAGPFQFMPATAKQYGLADPNDVGASADAAARLMKDNAAALSKSLGRDPTPAELYLAHQQGATGAAALIASPDKPAIDVLADAYGDISKARKAVLQNGGTADMTAGTFAALWSKKFKDAKPGDIQATELAPPPSPSAGSPASGPAATSAAAGPPTFAKTGTSLDILPDDERAALWKTAQKAAQPTLSRNLADQIMGAAAVGDDPASMPDVKVVKANLEGWLRKGADTANAMAPGDPVFADMVKSRIMARAHQIETVHIQAAQDASGTVMNAAIGLPPAGGLPVPGAQKPTSLDQLLAAPETKAAWLKMDPSAQHGIMQVLDHNAAGSQPKPDPVAFNTLNQRYINDVDAFRQTNIPEEFAGKLPYTEMTHFMQLQAAIGKSDKAAEDHRESLANAMTLSKDLLLQAGLHTGSKETKADKDFVANYQYALSKELDQFQADKKRKPTDTEVLGIADHLLMKGRVRGTGYFSDDQVSQFQRPEGREFYVPYGEIPADRAATVAAQLKAAGKPSDKAAVEQYYTQWRLAGNR
jgi:hypothetical protein